MTLWRKLIVYSRVTLRAFELTTRANMLDAWVLFGIIVQPVLVAILAFWMLEPRGGDYVIFVVVGSGMTGLWTSLLFISGNSITEERWTGTLELLVASPTHIQVVVLGKVMSNVIQSLLSMVFSYSLAVALFGYTPRIEQPALFIATLAFGVISYIGFGLLIAPLFILNPDVQRWQNGLEFPVYILSGFLFPIALLPGWTTPISYLLVPYWAARGLHATSSGGAALPELALSWGMMVLLSAIYLVVGRRLFKVLLRRARSEATLGMV